MTGYFPVADFGQLAEERQPTLHSLARSLRGTAQLLGSVAQSSDILAAMRPGLELLAQSLQQSADQAEQLSDDAHIDTADNSALTTSDLANMRFAPIHPPYHRQPNTLSQWKHASEQEFTLWGEVEGILSNDDVGLERRFLTAPDDYLMLVEQLEQQRARWLSEMKLLEAALLRLAVAVARWEQGDSR